MNCAEAGRLMQKTLAGDASEDECARIEAHAATCARCAERWRALTATAESLAGAQPETPTADRDLSAAVMAQIARDANGPTARWSRLRELLASRPVQAAGAVAATVLCALILWMATPSGQALAMLLGGGAGAGY